MSPARRKNSRQQRATRRSRSRTSTGAGRRKAQRHTIPKLPLARALARVVHEKELTQTAAGAIIGAAPSHMSLIMSGKLAGFSADRLMGALVQLGRDIEITVRPRTGGGRGRLVVRAV